MSPSSDREYDGNGRVYNPADSVVVPFRRTERQAVTAEGIRYAAGIEIAPEAAEPIARLFHETYERLAPAFAYETRPASAVPWDEVPAQNRALMIATCAGILEALTDAILPPARIVIGMPVPDLGPDDVRIGQLTLRPDGVSEFVGRFPTGTPPTEPDAT